MIAMIEMKDNYVWTTITMTNNNDSDSDGDEANDYDDIDCRSLQIDRIKQWWLMRTISIYENNSKF